jgi:hypothetical protein
MAGALALAVVVAPAVAAIGGAAAYPSPRVVADPAQCTGGESMDDYSLSCVPDVASDTGGAPSEMELTESNPGIESPEHR